MNSQTRNDRLSIVLGIKNGSRTRGASLDTSGEGRGQEGCQLFATGIRERLGAEHVIHDREPRERRFTWPPTSAGGGAPERSGASSRALPGDLDPAARRPIGPHGREQHNIPRSNP